MTNTTKRNALEDSIHKLLVKNKYDSEDHIIEKERNYLNNVNPDEIVERYQELKNMKHLLFQKERENKRKSKIKSKLYHKIKKRQRAKEEEKLLEELKEIDPESVRRYIESKQTDRVKERLTLKHSLNSKFLKVVKKMNLQTDENTKESIKENLRLRDKLLEKIKGNEDEYSEESVSEEENQDEDEEAINVDFNKNEKSEEEAEAEEKPKGVFGIKFMQNKNIGSKIKNVLDDFSDNEDEESIDDIEQIQIPQLQSKKINARSNPETKVNRKLYESINQEAEQLVKEVDQGKIPETELKNLLKDKEIEVDDEMYNNFIIQNNMNKEEFFQESTGKEEKPSGILEGWDTWAGSDKVTQTKEFLRKKRFQQKLDTKMNYSTVRINEKYDKKLANFAVQSLPHPYKSQEEFDRINNSNHVGRDWNTLTTYKQLIQPSIIKKIGQIIQPMSVKNEANAQKLCEIIEKSTKKKTRSKAKI